MIVINLPEKAHRRELFPQMVERANREGLFKINKEVITFVRSMSDGLKQKIWKGESCPICKSNNCAFRMVAIHNRHISAKACLKCKKMAIIGTD